jgi:hypothetical protein
MTSGDEISEQDIVSQWCAAGEQGDAGKAARCLAPGVELISPLTEQFRFVGLEQVRELLHAAFAVIDDIQFHTRVGIGETQAVFYRAHLGQQVLEEAQLLRLDSAGLIREITLFLRPLPALTGLMSTLGPALARQQDRPGLARFLTASTAPLHVMTRLGEHQVVPLAAPPATAPDPT